MTDHASGCSLLIPSAYQLTGRVGILAYMCLDHINDPLNTQLVLDLVVRPVPDDYQIWHPQEWLIGRYQATNQDACGQRLHHADAWAISGLPFTNPTQQTLAVRSFLAQLEPDWPVLYYPHALTGWRTA